MPSPAATPSSPAASSPAASLLTVRGAAEKRAYWLRPRCVLVIDGREKSVGCPWKAATFFEPKQPPAAPVAPFDPLRRLRRCTRSIRSIPPIAPMPTPKVESRDVTSTQH
ncbi:hypothetical protein AOQ84DRAFT_224936 [Glonium stellatum]|uniref:Uncharacterized protein n=1 Tax=Glonium stellatum TaxID=574774 RepID=A0A8E2EVH3_9PEZI|nr:hypothetical protein AOQ84DRAFT_224936 [Glonium stellatum]